MCNTCKNNIAKMNLDFFLNLKFIPFSQVKVFELKGLKCHLISGGLQIFKFIFTSLAKEVMFLVVLVS